MDATTLLARLSDPSADGPLDRLAALALDALLERPLGELVPPDLAVRLARHALDGWLEAPEAVPALERLVQRVAAAAAADRRRLADALPRDVRQAVREIVGRPFSPARADVLAIVDRAPTRELVRQLLLDTILDFGNQVSAPVAGVASRLGSLARAATETVKSYSGGLGSLVGAVSDEVERQLEKRAVEFVDAALTGVMGQIADAISDPRRATEAAEIRLAVFDGVLELTLERLARQLVDADVGGSAEVLRGGLTRWLAGARSDAQLLAIARFALGADASRPLRALLREAGLAGTVTTLGREWLRARLHDVVQSPAFSDWLETLARPDDPAAP